MNKADLVNLVAARTELTKTDVSQVVDAAIETIIDSVVEGKKVSILVSVPSNPVSAPLVRA